MTETDSRGAAAGVRDGSEGRKSKVVGNPVMLRQNPGIKDFDAVAQVLNAAAVAALAALGADGDAPHVFKANVSTRAQRQACHKVYARNLRLVPRMY